ncbi:MAG: DEAD/DEAH box helicase family protein [Pseudomonadota bacterium]|nr:DEAD/DEAH box helicase family protein [Pseudomonadota bacterium]
MGKEQTSAPVAPTEVESPIINSPFAEPAVHWQIERGKQPVQAVGRRPASYFYRVPESSGRGRKSKKQLSLGGELDVGQQEDLPLVNWLRGRVKEWREGKRTGIPYDGASSITKELLALWRGDETLRKQRLFFAQVEAAETLIFLIEANPVYHKGMPELPIDRPGEGAREAGFKAFTRYACKMATGTGKTTVMGMLSAWSILNRVASPTDDRFSDTVLIICPNVTIRERLQELDPALGDNSLYRTRQLVPPHRMEELRRGEVMIANWHRLAKKESSSVNGTSAKVVKTGEATEVVKNAGKANESIETRYFESDRAWFKRIRQELGSGKGRSPHWLVFNDEAHHAYRRGDGDALVDLEEDRSLAKKNAKEATIWIEGLDRINKLAGGRKKGIRFCIDLSATPFYIQGSGNEVGKPFPWIVSDFGLLDAIESGLVKIPQLPTRDITGAAEASYFNVWRWVEARAEQDGLGKKINPQIVMTYATAPINQLAQDWHARFEQWRQDSREELHPVPPVFIVVCRDTKVAAEVYNWLAYEEGSYGPAPTWFRNEPGNEVTVRVDSKVVEDLEAGGTKDETQRLRFILDTIGKKIWPGGKVPEAWSELVRKNNEKAASDDNDGAYKWVDERVPPGRNIRCIVSVAMLAEGWDANTVTHIVGLRPFGSQLLCEQVVGRALRRRSYALNEETDQFEEETAKVFGVPFELIPFKVSKSKDSKPPKEPNHIFSDPDKSQYEIEFPLVEGYYSPQAFELEIAWDQVSQVTIDPKEIPNSVELNSMTAPEGSLAVYGPGERPVLTLADWRKQFRLQQVAFRLAREVCRRWETEQNGGEESDVAASTSQLFPKVAFAAKRFLQERVKLIGNADPRDVLHASKYHQQAADILFEAIRRDGITRTRELPRIAKGSAGRGSTRFVDYHTTKEVYPVNRCHLNAMVADTKKWEQSAGYALDAHPGVVRWVKNEHLGFCMPYRKNGIPARYIPDFIAVLDIGLTLVIETKGQYGDDADQKAKAAERWVNAVNEEGNWGLWRYLVVKDPTMLPRLLDENALAKWDQQAGFGG